MTAVLFLLTAMAFAFDHSHAALTEVLKGLSTDEGVDYDAMAARRPKLQAYLATLGSADPEKFSAEEQLVFWINAYNALNLDLVLQEKPKNGVKDIDSGTPWSSRQWLVAGKKETLDSIEYFKINRLKEPRAHAAMNGAARSYPPLADRALSVSELSGFLDERAKKWVETNAYKITWLDKSGSPQAGPKGAGGYSIELNEVFQWNGAEFPMDQDLDGLDGSQERAVCFIAKYNANPDVAKGLLSLKPSAKWWAFDWSLNKK